jgi:hypothetical protein
MYICRSGKRSPSAPKGTRSYRGNLHLKGRGLLRIERVRELFLAEGQSPCLGHRGKNRSEIMGIISGIAKIAAIAVVGPIALPLLLAGDMSGIDGYDGGCDE